MICRRILADSYFSKPVGPSHITKRKKDYDKNVSVEPSLIDIVNTSKTRHVYLMLDMLVNNFKDLKI